MAISAAKPKKIEVHPRSKAFSFPSSSFLSSTFFLFLLWKLSKRLNEFQVGKWKLSFSLESHEKFLKKERQASCLVCKKSHFSIFASVASYIINFGAEIHIFNDRLQIPFLGCKRALILSMYFIRLGVYYDCAFIMTWRFFLTGRLLWLGVFFWQGVN